MIIIPVLVLFLLSYSRYKKINAYNAFVDGAKKGLNLSIQIFPYVVSILICVALFKVSGLSSILSKALAPIFSLLGIPNEISELIIFRPFSGSGSLAILSDIYKTYGVDSYASRCASVIIGSSETIFYVATVYFSQTKIKKLLYAIPAALIATFIGIIFGCLICKIL